MMLVGHSFCCTLTGLSLHSLILHIYVAPFVHSYSINPVIHSPSISHTSDVLIFGCEVLILVLSVGLRLL